jgi:translation initiation factor IF-2
MNHRGPCWQAASAFEQQAVPRARPGVRSRQRGRPTRRVRVAGSLFDLLPGRVVRSGCLLTERALAKRVFEIAKDLEVKSKAIVDKCIAEGIPNIQNHMSSVGAGLEATIREWFSNASQSSSGGSTATAVETAAKVDIEKVRAPAKKKAKATQKAQPKSDSGDDQDAGVEVSAGSDEHASAGAVAQDAPAAVARTAEMAEAAPASAASSAPAAASAPAVATPAAPADAEATAPAAPASEQSTTGDAARPAATAAPAATGGPERVTPKATQISVPAAPPAAGQDRDGGAGTQAPARPAAHVKPAPANVPTRPKVVTPAGPTLSEVQQKPAKLAGPKVVRIEAAEVIDAPRPRRPVGGPPLPAARGPRGGAGAGAPGLDTEDRAGNKRNKRRGGRGSDVGGDGKFRTQDLLEREERLSRSGGYLRQRKHSQRQKEAAGGGRGVTGPRTGKVTITAPFSIKDLSAATGVKSADIVKRLFMQGVMATVNSGIEPEQAQEIMIDFDIELEVVTATTAEEEVTQEFDRREIIDLQPRYPVVTILGHVDHGKTSLLDRIRNANVAAGEAGGITQATSAFLVPVKVGDESKQVCFFDTPGHQAFTAMRARGANLTDIVILVVAADDGVMPQTIESISHAKAAGVPIIVALNKIDLPGAEDANNIARILGQLAEHGLNPTDWGGDTEVVRISAATGRGIDELLEIIDLQAQVLELTADAKGNASGSVIESKLDEGRGSVANILVQEGLLQVGDVIVAGKAYGRVRDITNHLGQRIKSAGPSTPVQISGLNDLPDAGDKFFVVDNIRKAQEAAEHRRQREREKELAQPKVTLDSMFAQMAESELKELRVVLKADVQGSVDVIRKSVEDIATDEIKVRVLHAAVGGITESDVTLAEASGAVILGFNVIPSSAARQSAEQKKIQIRSYQVIYDIVDDMKKAAEGLLDPEMREEVLGHAEVRKVFRIGKTPIAGCYVTNGVIERNALIRVTRNDIVIEQERVLEQLKRFKDDAKEVRAGQECGMKVAGYDDIKEGDIIECYRKKEYKRTL